MVSCLWLRTVDLTRASVACSHTAAPPPPQAPRRITPSLDSIWALLPGGAQAVADPLAGVVDDEAEASPSSPAASRPAAGSTAASPIDVVLAGADEQWAEGGAFSKSAAEAPEAFNDDLAYCDDGGASLLSAWSPTTCLNACQPQLQQQCARRCPSDGYQAVHDDKHAHVTRWSTTTVSFRRRGRLRWRLRGRRQRRGRVEHEPGQQRRDGPGRNTPR